ncbi:hypothetical protein ACFSVK_09900 [Azorhizophilus paspali]|uniref:hypothetical protein n=1 Tax=Azorhizophilus paspali TaxID=69963 RepID=UPI003643D9B6
MKQKNIIVVLGMHRSGTSVITRGLQVLGVQLGTRLLPAKSDNEKGFWEDMDINALNVELLAALGQSWHTLAPLLPEHLKSTVLDTFKLRAVQLLREKLSGVETFGLKDPRIARLLPFWTDIFAHLDIKVSYMIACRHPMSVARSLAKRDGFALEKAYQLWLEYMLASLVGTQNHPRLVVDYDLLMTEPAIQLQRIAQALNLKFDAKSKAFTEFKENFLEEGLRHSRFAMDDLRLDKAASPQVMDLYLLLQAMATDQLAPDATELDVQVTGVAEVFRQTYPLLQYLDWTESSIADRQIVWESKIARLNEALAERDTQIHGLNSAAAERDALIAGLNEALAERDTQIHGLNSAAAERDALIAGLNEALAERDTQIHGLNGAAAERDALIAGLNEALAERDTQIHGLNGAAAERDALIAGLNEALAERDTQIHGLNGAAAERDALIAGLNEALAERDTQIHGLNGAVAERDELIAGLNEALAERDTQIHGLNGAVAERDELIAGLNEALAERDTQIHGLNGAVAERDELIAGLNEAFAERDTQIHGLNGAVAERDTQIHGLNGAVAERDELIAGLNEALAERDTQIHGLNGAVAERDEHIAGLNQAVAERDLQISIRQAAIDALHNSNSWRLCAPLRWVKAQVSRMLGIVTLVPRAIRHGGGVRLTLCKAINLYRREGVAGLRRGSALFVQAGSRSNRCWPWTVPSERRSRSIVTIMRNGFAVTILWMTRFGHASVGRWSSGTASR